MAKVKHTKNELKAQREALRRYERFLPMLQLKKQQLQMEIQRIAARCDDMEAQRQTLRNGLAHWQKLLSDATPEEIDGLVHCEERVIAEGNIAGVAIPVLKDVRVRTSEYDLFGTPTWFDDAVTVFKGLIRLQAEVEVLREQRRRVEEELRVTAQRVNLFEKVKIPACRENIRVIRIFLGDEQTAAVVRGKFAKECGRRKAEQAA